MLASACLNLLIALVLAGCGRNENHPVRSSSASVATRDKSSESTLANHAVAVAETSAAGADGAHDSRGGDANPGSPATAATGAVDLARVRDFGRLLRFIPLPEEGVGQRGSDGEDVGRDAESASRDDSKGLKSAARTRTLSSRKEAGALL